MTTFPIHMLDLDDFVAELRLEGYDARSDMFNGQVGLIIGPKGLDMNRLPSDVAALFFPLWEINYNSPLVQEREFHEIYEGRPADWQLNVPYNSQLDRTGRRHWSRSASLLAKDVADTIQREFRRRYPLNRVPLNIDVVGGQSQTFVTVYITNADLGIDEQRKAIPEDYMGKGGIVQAVLDATNDIITHLRMSGKIPAGTDTAGYTGLNLSLRPIGRVGSGPDMTKWTEVYQYVVENMPPKEEAWIANFGAPYRQNWRILRASDGVQGDWAGDHPSAEGALAFLVQELGRTS